MMKPRRGESQKTKRKPSRPATKRRVPEPVPTLPPEHELHAKLHRPRLHRNGVIFLAALAFTVLLDSGLTVANFVRKAPHVTTTASPIGQYANFAEQALLDWLSGRPTTLPLAAGLTPDLGRNPAATLAQTPGAATTSASLAASDVSFVSTTYAVIAGENVEQDTFLATTPHGRLSVLVQVAETPQGPVIAADPSFSVVGTQPSANAVGYNANASFPANLEVQLQHWTQAFSTHNQQQLTLLTDGSCTTGTVQTMPGWTVSAPKPISGITSPNGALQLVQVELRFQAGGRKGPVAEVPYDFLVGSLNAQYPSIVAWGPSGTGYHLYPCENFS